jgi:hypothetical protein
MTDAHLTFLFVCSILLVPILLAILVVGRRWTGRQIFILAIFVPLGFLAGGAAGWAAVPPIWQASLWTTIDASMNAAKYGASFEHTAERVLLYFVYGGIIGAVAAAIAGALAFTAAGRRNRASNAGQVPAR